MTASEIATTYRSALFSIAYRMTGEVMVSEDIVQDVLLNWINRSSAEVQDAKAYLAKSTMNASLNYLAQVKRQREAYKGIWLPEPVLAGHPGVDAKLDISYGFMLLLEKLSPLERAVFILKESFDVTYAELAEHFAITEANSRQLYHRATEKISGASRRFTLDSQQQQALLAAFSNASETGSIDTLIQLLKADVVQYSDGGGKVPAAINPLVGRAVVEQLLRSLTTKYSDQVTLNLALINGEVALLFRQKDTQQLSTLMVLEMDETGISSIYSIRNPDKLAHLQ